MHRKRNEAVRQTMHRYPYLIGLLTFGILGSSNSRIILESRTTQKVKVGITPIPGHNSNFSFDIKRRT